MSIHNSKASLLLRDRHAVLTLEAAGYPQEVIAQVLPNGKGCIQIEPGIAKLAQKGLWEAVRGPVSSEAERIFLAQLSDKVGQFALRGAELPYGASVPALADGHTTDTLAAILPVQSSTDLYVPPLPQSGTIGMLAKR